MNLAVYALFLLMVVSGLVVGMWNLGKVSRRAGITYTGPLSAARIYRYAFKDMKGSRETRMMVAGFGIMLLGPVVLGVLLKLFVG